MRFAYCVLPAVIAPSERAIDEKVTAPVAADVTEHHRRKCLAAAGCHSVLAYRLECTWPGTNG
jgi:hypothetical protein